MDKSLVREIKAAEKSHRGQTAFLVQIRRAAKELSTPDIMDGELLKKCINKYGRAVIVCLLASTIMDRADRLHDDTVRWAEDVYRVWLYRGYDTPTIADNLHPSRIEEYAGWFLQLT